MTEVARPMRDTKRIPELVFTQNIRSASPRFDIYPQFYGKPDNRAQAGMKLLPCMIPIEETWPFRSSHDIPFHRSFFGNISHLLFKLLLRVALAAIFQCCYTVFILAMSIQLPKHFLPHQPTCGCGSIAPH
jgi:hypothetical protein